MTGPRTRPPPTGFVLPAHTSLAVKLCRAAPHFAVSHLGTRAGSCCSSQNLQNSHRSSGTCWWAAWSRRSADACIPTVPLHARTHARRDWTAAWPTATAHRRGPTFSYRGLCRGRGSRGSRFRCPGRRCHICTRGCHRRRAGSSDSCTTSAVPLWGDKAKAELGPGMKGPRVEMQTRKPNQEVIAETLCCCISQKVHIDPNLPFGAPAMTTAVLSVRVRSQPFPGRRQASRESLEKDSLANVGSRSVRKGARHVFIPRQ